MLAVQHIRAERYKEAVKNGFSHEFLELEGTGIKLVDYIKEYSEQRAKSVLWADGRQYSTLIYCVNRIAPDIRLRDVNRIFAIKLRDALAETKSEFTGKLLKSTSIKGVFGTLGYIMQHATDEGKANFRQELLPTLKGLFVKFGVTNRLQISSFLFQATITSSSINTSFYRF